jgi:hypothetical protein
MERWVAKLSDGVGPTGQLIEWNPANWTEVGTSAFPAGATIQHLERASVPSARGRPALTRQAVRETHAALGPRGGFVAALVWGFGPTGYGASRVRKILGSPSAAAIVEDIWDTAATEGARAGFSALWENGRSRITGLGTAFGTKVLYFAATNDTPDPAPLVLDRFVYKGAHRLAAEGAIADASRVPDPRRYLASATYADFCAWAEQQSPGASDEVEYVLFKHGRT